EADGDEVVLPSVAIGDQQVAPIAPDLPRQESPPAAGGADGIRVAAEEVDSPRHGMTQLGIEDRLRDVGGSEEGAQLVPGIARRVAKKGRFELGGALDQEGDPHGVATPAEAARVSARPCRRACKTPA